MKGLCEGNEKQGPLEVRFEAAIITYLTQSIRNLTGEIFVHSKGLVNATQIKLKSQKQFFSLYF